MTKSTIEGGTIKEVVHSYPKKREPGDGGALPEVRVELYHCSNVSVDQMRDLRRMRE